MLRPFAPLSEESESEDIPLIGVGQGDMGMLSLRRMVSTCNYDTLIFTYPYQPVKGEEITPPSSKPVSVRGGFLFFSAAFTVRNRAHDLVRAHATHRPGGVHRA